MTAEELNTLCNQLFRERRFTAAKNACENALSGTLSRSEKCRVLLIKTRALVAEDGRWGGPAILCMKEALELAGTDPDERGRVLCAFTAAYAALGSVTMCQEYRTAFMELLKSHPSDTLHRQYPHVEYNLALAYHETEMLDEAEDGYLLALGAYQKLNDPAVAHLIADCKHNMIDVFQELGRHYEAKNLMDQVYPDLPDEVWGAQIRNRQAIYALSEGDLQAALLWAESGLGHRSCDVKTRAALSLTMARILYANGQASEAHDCGLDAMRLAAIAHNSRLSHRVSQFLKTVQRGG